MFLFDIYQFTIKIDPVNILLFIIPCVLAVLAEPRKELFHRIDQTDESMQNLAREVHELKTTLNQKLDQIITKLR